MHTMQQHHLHHRHGDGDGDTAMDLSSPTPTPATARTDRHGAWSHKWARSVVDLCAAFENAVGEGTLLASPPPPPPLVPLSQSSSRSATPPSHRPGSGPPNLSVGLMPMLSRAAASLSHLPSPGFSPGSNADGMSVDEAPAAAELHAPLKRKRGYHDDEDDDDDSNYRTARFVSDSPVDAKGRHFHERKVLRLSEDLERVHMTGDAPPPHIAPAAQPLLSPDRPKTARSHNWHGAYANPFPRSPASSSHHHHHHHHHHHGGAGSRPRRRSLGVSRCAPPITFGLLLSQSPTLPPSDHRNPPVIPAMDPPHSPTLAAAARATVVHPVGYPLVSARHPLLLASTSSAAAAADLADPPALNLEEDLVEGSSRDAQQWLAALARARGLSVAEASHSLHDATAALTSLLNALHAAPAIDDPAQARDWVRSLMEVVHWVTTPLPPHTAAAPRPLADLVPYLPPVWRAGLFESTRAAAVVAHVAAVDEIAKIEAWLSRGPPTPSEGTGTPFDPLSTQPGTWPRSIRHWREWVRARHAQLAPDLVRTRLRSLAARAGIRLPDAAPAVAAVARWATWRVLEHITLTVLEARPAAAGTAHGNDDASPVAAMKLLLELAQWTGPLWLDGDTSASGAAVTPAVSPTTATATTTPSPGGNAPASPVLPLPAVLAAMHAVTLRLLALHTASTVAALDASRAASTATPSSHLTASRSLASVLRTFLVYIKVLNTARVVATASSTPGTATAAPHPQPPWTADPAGANAAVEAALDVGLRLCNVVHAQVRRLLPPSGAGGAAGDARGGGGGANGVAGFQMQLACALVLSLASVMAQWMADVRVRDGVGEEGTGEEGDDEEEEEGLASAAAAVRRLAVRMPFAEAVLQDLS
ncbi:hypothetical protein H9P43_009312 [Blastocladiella emersonii ATCC 22665]|nr:hypothetical protein H9P43_009312 [Blastocladiella emersonii ATCC 22665]